MWWKAIGEELPDSMDCAEVRLKEWLRHLICHLKDKKSIDDSFKLSKNDDYYLNVEKSNRQLSLY
jgi:hypothetical protein